MACQNFETIGHFEKSLRVLFLFRSECIIMSIYIRWICYRKYGMLCSDFLMLQPSCFLVPFLGSNSFHQGRLSFGCIYAVLLKNYSAFVSRILISGLPILS